jgi:integrase
MGHHAPMPRRTKFTPKSTLKGWRLNVPGKFTESGKRERYYYPSREAANQAAKDLREKRDRHGDSAKAISPALAEQAVAAARLLEPFGVSLLEAARVVAAIEASKAASATVKTASDLFTAAKEDLSVKQTQAIRHMVTHLVDDFADRLMSTISLSEIAEHIESKTNGAAAYNARLRLLVTFWKWCGHPNRAWCDPDTLKHAERKDHVSGEVGVLTVAEAAKLMKTAEEFSHAECVAGFAIALFTGIRQAEIARLEPEDITEEGIHVPIAANAKSNRRRFIEMPAPLAAWLKAYPIGETVLPANWRRKEMAVRRLAGWRVWCDITEPREAPEDLPEWPQNALRHTAASVALAMGKPIETLIFEHGHTEGVTTLKSHYIGRMTKKDALAIMSIGPHGTKVPNIHAA